MAQPIKEGPDHRCAVCGKHWCSKADDRGFVCDEHAKET